MTSSAKKFYLTGQITLTVLIFSVLFSFQNVSAKSKDRAQDFYQGADDQIREQRNQDMKASIKEMQKQQKEMERASTQDPGRKAQLTREINKLQKEIMEHRAQAAALKKHADKARDAAKKAEAGKERKGKQKKKKQRADVRKGPEKAEQISAKQMPASNQDNQAPSMAIQNIDSEIVDLQEIEKEEEADQKQFEQAVKESKANMQALVAGEGIKIRETPKGDGDGASIRFDEEFKRAQEQSTKSASKISVSRTIVNRPSVKVGMFGLKGGSSFSLGLKGKKKVKAGTTKKRKKPKGIGRKATSVASFSSGSPDLLTGLRKIASSKGNYVSQNERILEEQDSPGDSSKSDSQTVPAKPLTNPLKERQPFILGSTPSVRHRIARR